jgi:diguanylate cyclase (GGDEF)-like protein
VNTYQRIYRALLSHLLPPDLDRSSDDARNLVRLVHLALLSALVIPCFILEFLYFQIWNLAIGLSVAGAVMVGSPWIFKKTGSLTLTREAFLCSLFGFKLWESLFFNGVISPGSMWFIAMPIASILLGSWRSGLCWLVVTIGSLIGLHVSLDSNVRFIGSPVPDPAFMYMFSLIFMALALACFVFMVDAERKKAMRRLKEANETVRELAMRDPLTGLYNRRYLWSAMENEERRAATQPGTLFICLIDVDKFKNINDTFGHAIGDQVLQAIAKAIATEVRQEDCFGRYGGEEFMVLVKGASSRAALAFAERLRRCVSSLRFEDVRGLDSVTVSIGIAQFQHNEGLGKTVSRADDALYAAKAAGRNCIRRAIHETDEVWA